MRNAVREYIDLSEREKKALWDSATFVFDTNVFLNLYRYSKKTSDTLINAMEHLGVRIWMPNHVAHEFMKRRPEIIIETSERHTKLKNETEKFVKECCDILRIKKEDSEYQQLKELIDKWVEAACENNSLVKCVAEDKILEKILAIFDGKVGVAFEKDALDQIMKEGSARYSKKIPPGYKDAAKANQNDDNNAYGDLIVWKEILQYAKVNRKDIIFVTHDQKEDWWSIVHGKTLGPRIELIKEFLDTTEQKFHMYSMDSFIRLIEESRGGKIDQRIIEEISTIDERKRFVPRVARFNPAPIEKAIAQAARSQREKYIEIEQLGKQIEYLESKNQRRRDFISEMKRKYRFGAMPDHISEQVKNNQDSIERDRWRIIRYKDKLQGILEGPEREIEPAARWLRVSEE